MKKLFIVAFAIFYSVSSVFAQDAKKALKSASKNLAKYYQDPVTNAGLLDVALTAVNTAFSDPLVQADPESWLIKGDIYNSIGKSESDRSFIDKNFKLKTLDAGLEATKALIKAKELAVKKNHTKDALSGLAQAEVLLSGIGSKAFETQEYAQAFKNFSSLIQVGNLLKENKVATSFDKADYAADVQYYNVVSGFYGKVADNELLPYLDEMFKAGSDKALVYEALYSIKSKSDETAALSILEAGRKKLPEETSLLFAEINYYLGKGKLDILVEKLKAAIAKEPKNVTVYTTLGNVYDQLVTKEKEAGNVAKSQEYFDLAMDYYKQALALDEKNATAVYSIGALYYNKAAAYTSEINKLSSDYSAAATKKYEALKVEMNNIFDTALPYFLKSETLDGKDKNTLIALKEIYAKKSLFDKVKEYKEKLEKLETEK
jgi:tetratricopeptide (TPR) repeat protein